MQERALSLFVYQVVSETHIAPHLARPKIPERPHINMVTLFSSERDLKVEGVSVWEQDNVELISIDMPGVVVHSVYKPPNDKFVLPTLGQPQPHLCI